MPASEVAAPRGMGHLIGTALQALCGLVLGALAAGELGLGAGLAQLAQKLVGLYELAAPALLFAILAPAFLKLLRSNTAGMGRFSLFAIAWFSALRLAVCLAATAAVCLLYRLPWQAPSAAGQEGGQAGDIASSLVGNRYLLAILAALACARLLRDRDGAAIDWFLRLPDAVDALGSGLTRLTGVFGFLVGAYIVSLPQVLVAATRGIGGPMLHPLDLGWLRLDAATSSGLFRIYLLLSAVTALFCMALHAALVLWTRARVPGFTVGGYVASYLLRVYPLIWSTGSEALAVPANFAALRRYGGSIPAPLRDVAVGAAAALNMNGSLICCLVLVPAVCAVIGFPLSAVGLAACLPVVFMLGYGIPGIPGELVVFAGPVAQALALPDAQRPLFLLLFLGWQIGLTDAFRSAGSATDCVPAVLLLNRSYSRLIAGRNG